MKEIVQQKNMKRIKVLLLFVFLFLIVSSVARAEGNSTAKLEAIKTGIPKVWDGTVWDKTKELKDFLTEYTEKDSTGAEALFWLGYNYRVLGKPDNAISEFKKIVAEYPNCYTQVKNAQFEMAQLYYYDKKDYDAAISQYELVSSTYPNSWEGRYSYECMGNVYMTKGDESSAIMAFQKAYEQGQVTAGIAKASLLLLGKKSRI